MRKLEIILTGIVIATLISFLIIGANNKSNKEAKLEEYVPKVIIEGKWGKEPGEFGKTIMEGEGIYPGNLVVDSEENIYILDKVNNRIQKFSKNGEYILSIPVKSLQIESGNELSGYLPVAVENVDILSIDSEDLIYIPQGKIVHKYDKSGKLIDKVSHDRLKDIENQKKKVNHDKYTIKISKKISKNIQKILILKSGILKNEIYVKSKYIIDLYFLNSDIYNNFYIFNLHDKKIYKYNINGKLKSEISIGRHFYGGKEVMPFIDMYGNIYEHVTFDTFYTQPEKQETEYKAGLRIIKWELQPN